MHTLNRKGVCYSIILPATYPVVQDDVMTASKQCTVSVDTVQGILFSQD